MASRITWGLLLGLVFLFVTLQSQPWVLFAFGVVHFVSQLEFMTLARDQAPAGRVGHAVLTTLLWLLISLALTGGLPGMWLAVVLAVLIVACACAAVAAGLHASLQLTKDFHYGAWSVPLITLPMACVPLLLHSTEGGLLYLLLIGASWGADSGAIFAGKLLGRTKLSPQLSPKKTVEGVSGGALAAGLIWSGAVLLYPAAAARLSGGIAGEQWQLLVVMCAVGACMSVVGLFGDLTFSLFKRQAGVKDYGAVIPGHGGMLDRFDSLVFVAPVLLAAVMAW